MIIKTIAVSTRIIKRCAMKRSMRFKNEVKSIEIEATTSEFPNRRKGHHCRTNTRVKRKKQMQKSRNASES